MCHVCRQSTAAESGCGCWGWWWHGDGGDGGAVVPGVMDGGWKKELVDDWWRQIEHWHLLMLNLAMAIWKQYLPSLVAYLLMVLWCSSKNATLFMHMMCPGAQCLILDVVTIFDYIYNGDSTDSHGNHSQRLRDSDHFHWNSLEKSWNFHGIGKQNGWGSSQLLSIENPWNSAEFRLSTQNPQELMEEGKDLRKDHLRWA